MRIGHDIDIYLLILYTIYIIYLLFKIEFVRKVWFVIINEKWIWLNAYLRNTTAINCTFWSLISLFNPGMCHLGLDSSDTNPNIHVLLNMLFQTRSSKTNFTTLECGACGINFFFRTEVEWLQIWIRMSPINS
jgi:hypothetical protein